jgi:hypothetical protein
VRNDRCLGDLYLQVALLSCSGGGFKGTGSGRKNYSGQIGAAWQRLTEEEKRPYEDQCERMGEEADEAQTVLLLPVTQGGPLLAPATVRGGVSLPVLCCAVVQ